MTWRVSPALGGVRRIAGRVSPSTERVRHVTWHASPAMGRVRHVTWCASPAMGRRRLAREYAALRAALQKSTVWFSAWHGTPKITHTDRLTELATGVVTVFGSWSKITLGGQDYTPTQIADELRTVVVADQVTAADRDKLTADTQAARTAYTRIAALVRYLRMFAIVQLSDDPDAAEKLGQLGLSPRKPPKTTAATKAGAAAKARSTRNAKKTALAGAVGLAPARSPAAPAAAASPGAAPAPAGSPSPVK